MICECGNVATRFFDDNGNELVESCCDECWFFQLEKLEKLFGNFIQHDKKDLQKQPDNRKRKVTMEVSK